MMTGWKTWLGGLIAIGVGVWLIIRGQLEVGLGFISGGISVLGVGHKIEKAVRQKNGTV